MEKTFKVIRLEVVENDYIAVSTADCEYSTAFDVHIDGKVICKRTPPYFYFESKEEAIDYLIKRKIQATSRLHGSIYTEESVFKKLDTHKRIREIKDHYKSVIDKVSKMQLSDKKTSKEELVEQITRYIYHDDEIEKLLRHSVDSRKNMSTKKEKIDYMFNSACGRGMAEGNGIQSKFDTSGNYLPDKKGGTKEGGRKAFHKCMNSIPDEYFDDFIYTLYCIADKSGHNGFSI